VGAQRTVVNPSEINVYTGVNLWWLLFMCTIWINSFSWGAPWESMTPANPIYPVDPIPFPRMGCRCSIEPAQTGTHKMMNRHLLIRLSCALWGFIVQRVKSDRRGVVNMVLRAPWGARKQGSSRESAGEKLCGVLPRRTAKNGNRRQVAAELHCVEGASKVVGVHAGKHGNSHRSHASHARCCTPGSNRSRCARLRTAPAGRSSHGRPLLAFYARLMDLALQAANPIRANGEW
jgi:hypothetical protein